MYGLPKAFEQLVERLQKLPGVGPRTAYRLAFFMLNWDPEEAGELANAILKLKSEISYCKQCFSLAENELCSICSDPKREQSLICVVEEPRDVFAVERTSEFRGVYHVLGGVLSPVDGVGPDQLRIKELLKRIEKNTVSEIIIATNPTVNGEATTMYLSKLLKPRVDIVTRLASGIPFGGDLDFADEVTLSRALESRRAL